MAPRPITLSTHLKVSLEGRNLNLDGCIRIIEQNTGTRAIAKTPSGSPAISLSVHDGFDSEESFLLVLDLSNDLTVWSIKPWNVDSADVAYIPV